MSSLIAFQIFAIFDPERRAEIIHRDQERLFEMCRPLHDYDDLSFLTADTSVTGITYYNWNIEDVVSEFEVLWGFRPKYSELFCLKGLGCLTSVSTQGACKEIVDG